MQPLSQTGVRQTAAAAVATREAGPRSSHVPIHPGFEILMELRGVLLTYDTIYAVHSLQDIA